MDTFVPALVLLSGAAFIHSRSNVPELRPASEKADLIWSWLSRFAFMLWLGLLVWGTQMRPLKEVLLGLGLSLLFNLMLALRGPRPVWPGLSMSMGVAGVAMGIYRLLQ
ncbi:multidrug DMT transporter permease [Roseomonas marmotae]|uniref:Multidrug DMT transporter permease n=1 Tax=Roseomonas marmotae TaxID=2768161 RepID=A0ABS3KCX7_9PROT|nr:multidrug DMT transporter permease [Roseomonas marmotae]MBO1074852.1 multidrug DMT transporter permease [Roseomonas marmotae]QTI80643.1 multidrug DMT transporter permease [Roseomonas marmotae]